MLQFLKYTWIGVKTTTLGLIVALLLSGLLFVPLILVDYFKNPLYLFFYLPHLILLLSFLGMIEDSQKKRWTKK